MLPTEHCPSGIRGQFHMPNCWNGKDVQPPTDSRKHITYMTGAVRAGSCPPDVPHRLPRLFYEVNYNTQRFLRVAEYLAAPFRLRPGRCHGVQFPWDFVNGW
ncbi:hypothetical protein CC80DRAFT_425280 [Byssothecium circinans]|uniref:DUF1996 domain-containing protein n=1 Tax=Byssothecium circinans TaxID=147558 RepID=A0A6A5TQE0_9PLEO|nr:hypothetical protein CC80DRAFT_425280 [Byssothecium circinans]